MNRRFPPPWTFEEANNACFVIKGANGLAVSYAYFESEPGRRSAANLTTKDEARRSPSKLDVLRSRIADARGIIDAHQALLEKLRKNGEPTNEAEAALRTHMSALMQLLGHEERLRLEARAKKRETKK
jgi:hypothetical protein